MTDWANQLVESIPVENLLSKDRQTHNFLVDIVFRNLTIVT